MKRGIIVLLLFCAAFELFAQQPVRSITGRVVGKGSGEPVPAATVMIWNGTKGTVADSAGGFVIPGVAPGMYRIEVSSLGYKPWLSPEFQVTSYDPRFTVELEPDSLMLAEIVVRPSPFPKRVDAPLSFHSVGVKEIEKSPGANRDISKVVTSLPGVGNSVGNGYRNDLMVRGGGPSENRFYLDGVEIPNINHFSTQGASGGPVGIIDADLIREVDFYSGAFPANRGNALSSVMDFKLRDGNTDRHVFKATVGASEVAFGANGHIGKKTTYLVSVRQSYLQLLFSVLDLPFLPNFTDAQFKVRTRFSPRHELTLLGLGAIDHMKLNEGMDTTDDSRRYLLGYLPEINQKTYTLGAVYRHRAGNHSQTVVLSNSFLNNRNTKYLNNDDSDPDNRTLYINSDEVEYHFRAEHTSALKRFRINAGINLDYSVYRNTLQQRVFTDRLRQFDYHTDLGIVRWGLFASGEYASPDGRFGASLGLRLDANNAARSMRNLFEQFSPRLSLSYRFAPKFYINATAGRFYQLPAYTTIGFRDNAGNYTNLDAGLTYIRSDQFALGVEYRLSENSRITAEGFYKHYDQTPVSLLDSIPLAGKGDDYGTVGAEPVRSTGKGRAYGMELMYRLAGLDRVTLSVSYTLFWSRYIDPRSGSYAPSSWDDRHLLTLIGGYAFRRNWTIGAKFRLLGGSPYTPYDADKSSLVEAWNATARPYYDYGAYNTGRLGFFNQLDIRVDKSFYFKGWMLGIYLDIQNVLGMKYDNPDILMSTGVIDPATAGLPADQQRYLMKRVRDRSGTILPTLGITVEF